MYLNEHHTAIRFQIPLSYKYMLVAVQSQFVLNLKFKVILLERNIAVEKT